MRENRVVSEETDVVKKRFPPRRVFSRDEKKYSTGSVEKPWGQKEGFEIQGRSWGGLKKGKEGTAFGVCWTGLKEEKEKKNCPSSAQRGCFDAGNEGKPLR